MGRGFDAHSAGPFPSANVHHSYKLFSSDRFELVKRGRRLL